MNQSPHSRTSATTRRLSLEAMISQSTVMLMTAIGTLILLLALMILFHENANATKGYRLRTLQHERSALLLEEEVLKMQLATQQSLDTLQQDEQISTMVTPKNIVYLRADAAVAAGLQQR